MVHCPGTRPHNTGLTPREAELEVFRPNVLLREHPILAPVFDDFVQCFAQRMGITMDRWDVAESLRDGHALYNSDRMTLSKRWVHQDQVLHSSTHTLGIGDIFPGLTETLLTPMSFPASSLPHASVTPSTGLNASSSPNLSKSRYIYALYQPRIKPPYSDHLNSGTPDQVVEWETVDRLVPAAGDSGRV